MSTRAIVGTIETDAAGNQVLTSTYNHYDGYPESLGVALNNHYNSNEDAIRISNQGYISFLDPETGEVDAKHKEGYEAKWNAFLNEGEEDVVGIAKSILKDEPYLDEYIDSLTNDIYLRQKGKDDDFVDDTYDDYGDDDWEEDYNYFIQNTIDY